MAAAKIIHRNLATKIVSSKEICSVKNKNMPLGVEKQQPMFAKNTSKVDNKSRNGSWKKKETTSSYWNDQSKTLTREESKGPLRAIRSAFCSRPTIILAPSRCKLSTKESLTKTVKRIFGPKKVSTEEEILSQRSAVASLAANRRLLKPSNGFKIFPNRRFSSSASSSSCSIFRRHDDRGHASSFKRTFIGGFEERVCNTQTTFYGANHSIASIAAPKYLEAVRNQHMPADFGPRTKSANLTSGIQQDLMPIDKTLRERISFKNPIGLKPETEQKEKDPAEEWQHSPSPDIFSSRLLDRRSVAALTVQEVSRPHAATNRKRRLDLQCKLLPDSSSTVPIPSVPAATTVHIEKASQVSQALSAGDNTRVRSKIGSSQLTARRFTSVDPEHVRRFSLRRPPKSTVTEVKVPPPGPAAESLQHTEKSYNASRTLPSLTWRQKQGRYNR